MLGIGPSLLTNVLLLLARLFSTIISVVDAAACYSNYGVIVATVMELRLLTKVA